MTIYNKSYKPSRIESDDALVRPREKPGCPHAKFGDPKTCSQCVLASVDAPANDNTPIEDTSCTCSEGLT